jgi:hypothetical protein
MEITFNPVLIALVVPAIGFALAILVGMAWRDTGADSDIADGAAAWPAAFDGDPDSSNRSDGR